jgi:hypothetical protein
VLPELRRMGKGGQQGPDHACGGPEALPIPVLWGVRRIVQGVGV